jgi:Family of unknown function (DUF6152)
MGLMSRLMQLSSALTDRLVFQRTALVCLSFCVTPAAFPHHAPTEFDFLKVVEVEGTVVEVKWRNPHVLLKIRDDSKGSSALWEVESSSIAMLHRMNVAGERPVVKDKVRIAGHPSRRDAKRLWGTNLLLANDRELVFEPHVQPRWKTAAAGTASRWLDGAVEPGKSGIFRVWSTKLDDPWSDERLDRLTDAARAKRAQFDPLTDSVTQGCEPVGMPMLMAQPYPIEFVQQQDKILLRIELYDLVRTIHMNEAVSQSSLPKHILGRSTGRWEGNTLVVKTDGIAWPYLEYDGTPLSPDASLIERFTPTDDGTRLNYSVIITDPIYLSAPAEATRSWVARPNESVKPFECEEER